MGTKVAFSILLFQTKLTYASSPTQLFLSLEMKELLSQMACVYILTNVPEYPFKMSEQFRRAFFHLERYRSDCLFLL